MEVYLSHEENNESEELEEAVLVPDNSVCIPFFPLCFQPRQYHGPKAGQPGPNGL